MAICSTRETSKVSQGRSTAMSSPTRVLMASFISSGKTTPLPAKPWVRAFIRERSLPSSEVGPRLRAPLAREAFCWRSEDMFAVSRCEEFARVDQVPGVIIVAIARIVLFFSAVDRFFETFLADPDRWDASSSSRRSASEREAEDTVRSGITSAIGV